MSPPEPSLSEIDQLDSLHRQLLKLSEEEKAILQEEPTDVIRNLEILIALRSATEADPQSRAPSVPKSRKRKNDHEGSAADSPGPATIAVSEKLNRIKGSAQRSTSVSSMQAREARDSVSVKIEEGTEAAKGTAAEKSGQFVIGAEVVFKHNKKQHGVEGEGIQCIIKNVSGEGSKKRYNKRYTHTTPITNVSCWEDTMSRIPNRTRMANKEPCTRPLLRHSSRYRMRALAYPFSHPGNKSLLDTLTRPPFTERK